MTPIKVRTQMVMYRNLNLLKIKDIQNKDGSKYYYYIKKDLLCTKEMTDDITIDNIDSFLWCITRF